MPPPYRVDSSVTLIFGQDFICMLRYIPFTLALQPLAVHAESVQASSSQFVVLGVGEITLCSSWHVQTAASSNKA